MESASILPFYQEMVNSYVCGPGGKLKKVLDIFPDRVHNKVTVSTIHKCLSILLRLYRSFRAEFPVMLRRGRQGGGVFIFLKTGLLAVVLLGGALYDIREQRIPNWWCACGCVLGLWLTWRLAPAGQGAGQAVLYIIRLLAVTAIWFPLFRLRMIGAGDVKLMALMAGYLGFAVSAGVILYGFFIGAILAFLKMLVYRNLYQRLNYFFAYIRRLFQTREAVPYYQASRDGKEAVIPLGLCLLGGCVWYVVRGILC